MTRHALRALPAVLSLAGLLPGAAAWAAGAAIQSGAWEITARIEMPHLEESLRYSTTRERRCLGPDDFPSLFPVLRHESLAGCRLGDAGRDGSTGRYRLVCANPQAASGTAVLDLNPGRMAGVLEVKMGGKNMTFTQRVEATRLGECSGTP